MSASRHRPSQRAMGPSPSLSSIRSTPRSPTHGEDRRPESERDPDPAGQTDVGSVQGLWDIPGGTVPFGEPLSTAVT